MNHGTLLTILEESKDNLFSRKNMLVLNEKAFDLLNLLRKEIFT